MSKNISAAEYSRIHQWLRRTYGPAVLCSVCKDPTKRAEWASLDHAYTQDAATWAQMCKPCHYAYDKSHGERVVTLRITTHCRRGHELTPENTYTRGRSKRCKRCQKESNERNKGKPVKHKRGPYNKLYCPHGHEYTEETTGVNSKGARVCKACRWERYHTTLCKKCTKEKSPPKQGS